MSRGDVEATVLLCRKLGHDLRSKLSVAMSVTRDQIDGLELEKVDFTDSLRSLESICGYLDELKKISQYSRVDSKKFDLRPILDEFGYAVSSADRLWIVSSEKYLREVLLDIDAFVMAYVEAESRYVRKSGASNGKHYQLLVSFPCADIDDDCFSTLVLSCNRFGVRLLRAKLLVEELGGRIEATVLDNTRVEMRIVL